MPSRKKKNGEFKDVAHPLNNETRRMIEDKVLGEYERVLGERGESLPLPVERAERASSDGELPGGGLVSEKTMEEVEEMHLRDSFWTVT
jgi:hypothetical protein